MIKFRWAKRLMQDAEKVEEWLTGDSMSDPKPLPVKHYPDNTNERIEKLEEKIAEVAEDNKRLKKMLLKCSVDMANLETIINAAVIGQSQIISDIQALYTFLKRIEGETGISYTEFAYQLMQGYDFYWLYKNKNCKLQMGGSDQWGNITTGTELIRRKAGGEGFAFTCPLITKTDGGKFGKTEKGNVWLDPEKTSPYQFYQFWLNAADADAEKWIKIFTLLPLNEISSLIAEHQKDPGLRLLQKKLAFAVTSFVHGVEEAEKAIQTTEQLFGKKEEMNLNDMTEDDLLGSMEGVPVHVISKDLIEQGIDIVSLLADTGIFPSKSEARKMVLGGGVSVNRQKIADINHIIDKAAIIAENYIIIQKGKKNYYLIKRS